MKTTIKDLNYSLSGAICTGALLLMVSRATAQNLFVAANNNIYEITPGGSQSLFASGLNDPEGIAFNSAGNLFVANTANNAIPAAGSITEIAPNGTPSIFASGIDPQAVAFDSTGNLYEADYRSGNINKYAPNGAFLGTFASGFTTPISLTFDSSGNLFVGSGFGAGNGVVTKITPGGTQSVFASGLDFPLGLAFNSTGDLFEADDGGSVINEFTSGGAPLGTFASVTSPDQLAFNSAGNLFVSTHGGAIIQIAPNGAESPFASISGITVGIAFSPVPEPSAFALLGIGAVAFFARRRISSAKS